MLLYRFLVLGISLMKFLFAVSTWTGQVYICFTLSWTRIEECLMNKNTLNLSRRWLCVLLLSSSVYTHNLKKTGVYNYLRTREIALILRNISAASSIRKTTWTIPTHLIEWKWVLPPIEQHSNYITASDTRNEFHTLYELGDSNPGHRCFEGTQ